MLKSVVRTSDRTNLDQPFAVQPVKLGWRYPLAIFLIVAAITSVHHIFETGVKTALLFDGRHYFECVRHMCDVMSAWMTFKPEAIVAAEHGLREWIMKDGPVLPTFFALAFQALGHAPTSSDWPVFVFIQTFLHAATAALVCLLSFAITRNRAASFVSGLWWGLYPSAVLSSGRLMTETLSVLFLVALPLSFKAAKDRAPMGIVGGLVSGIVLQLKPGMILSIVLSGLTCLFLTRKRVAVFLALALGAGITVTPWLLYTKLTTGKAAFLVQRWPVHNALIGWDEETAGWQTNPPSGFERVMLTVEDPLTVIAGTWISHPAGSLRLMAEKFGLLFSTPWNDYRARVFGMNAQAQAAWHYALMLGGLFGFFTFLFFDRKRKETLDIALLCTASAAGQFIYVMFEPVCRYEFPLMAFAAVFSAVALKHVFEKKDLGQARILLVTAASLALLTIGLVALSQRIYDDRLRETQHIFAAGQEAVKTLKIKSGISKTFDTALVLIDGEKELEGASVQVNGYPCRGPLLPFNYFDADKYQSFNLMKELGYGMSVGVDDFRQWRAIAVPVDALRASNEVRIEIKSASSPLTIYGDNKASRTFLSPDYLCVNRLINSKTSLEMRNHSAITSGQCAQGSFIKDQSTEKQLPDSLRVKLVLAAGSPRLGAPALAGTKLPTREVSSPPGSAGILAGTRLPTERANSAYAKDLTGADFDPLLKGPDGTIKISKTILKSARTTGTSVQLPDFGKTNALFVSLTGEIRSGLKPGRAGIVVETVTNKNTGFFLGRLPPYVSTNKDWQKFAIDDLVPYTSSQGRVTAIRIALFPGPWQQVAGYGCDKNCTDIALRHLRIEVKAAPIVNLAGKRLSYF